LQNSIRRAVSVVKKNKISDEDFEFLDFNNSHREKSDYMGFSDIIDLLNLDEVVPLKEVELAYIKEALRIHKGNKEKASKFLKVSRQKIYRKI